MGGSRRRLKELGSLVKERADGTLSVTVLPMNECLGQVKARNSYLVAEIQQPETSLFVSQVHVSRRLESKQDPNTGAPRHSKKHRNWCIQHLSLTPRGQLAGWRSGTNDAC